MSKQAKRQPPGEWNFSRILIVQTAFIGDVILVTPLIQRVAHLFPRAQLHFLTIPASRNLVETLPYLKRLWLFDKRGQDRGISGLWRLGTRLRAEQFDLVLVPHRSIRSALLAWLTRAPLRIGFDRSAGNFLFTHQVTYRQDRHEVERNLSLLTPLGIESPQKLFPEIVTTREDKQAVETWMRRSGLSDTFPLVVLAPASVWPTKRWPARYWGRLACQLLESGFQVALIGSKQDRFLLPQIRSICPEGLHSAMGELTLRQSAELIRRSQLLISNDSAPTHLGVAMRTPVLTIFGPTVPEFGFYPYGERDRVVQLENLDCRPCSIHGGKTCPREHFHCMIHLIPQIVFQQAKEILYENSKDSSGSSEKRNC